MAAELVIIILNEKTTVKMAAMADARKRSKAPSDDVERSTEARRDSGVRRSMATQGDRRRLRSRWPVVTAAIHDPFVRQLRGRYAAAAVAAAEAIFLVDARLHRQRRQMR